LGESVLLETVIFELLFEFLNAVMGLARGVGVGVRVKGEEAEVVPGEFLLEGRLLRLS
jgi:hypothetical protein